MHRFRSWVRAFFGFSRHETNAFVILLPLMLVAIIIIPTYKNLVGSTQPDYSKEIKELDSIVAYLKVREKSNAPESGHEMTLSRFNPNTATSEELTRLGFSEKTAQRLENYRSKGGKFIIKSDLLKLYGMDTLLYKNIYPYIDLPEVKPEFKKDNYPIPIAKQNSIIEKFDLNLADSMQLISIYGIGSKLSARIIAYRNSLGGFIKMTQLYEVYGLDSATIKQVANKAYISDNFQPRLLSINSATEKELARHPYIRYKLAKVITTYRFQHGNFSSLDELRNIELMNEQDIDKAKPYLTINP
jgi:competence protein ComEA